jgi:amino acid transporter
MSKFHSPTLTTFKLLMIAIISVDSLRNLPINAQYGLPLITFFLIGGVTFFLPLLLITNFLAKSSPATGGSYVWIQSAFGPRLGFVSVWLQWVYNMIWYPTIFAFLGATLSALIHPAAQDEKGFILLSCLLLFWILTALCCHGVKSLSWMSAIGSCIGTLLPMLAIILLAAYWLLSGRPSATPLSWEGLLPTKSSFDNLGFFANILFSLLGIDVIAMHGKDVRHPERTFPKVLSLAGWIIWLSLVLSSFAICVVLPAEHISLTGGLVEAFDLFFAQYHIPWAHSLICLAIILGGLGIVTSWMSGLARGLHVAALSANVPACLKKLNRYGMPYPILIAQALIFTLLLGAFLLFPDINSSYWLLSSMTAQFALIYYFILFFAAFKLLKKAHQSSAYFPAIALALLSSFTGFAVGFFPPSSVISASQIFHYELTLFSIGALFLLPLIYFLRKTRPLNS